MCGPLFRAGGFVRFKRRFVQQYTRSSLERFPLHIVRAFTSAEVVHNLPTYPSIHKDPGSAPQLSAALGLHDLSRSCPVPKSPSDRFHKPGASSHRRTSTLYASLRLRFVPSAFRVARILPLKNPEKADYTQPKAYRPISLLSTKGKILELVGTELQLFTDASQRNGLTGYIAFVGMEKETRKWVQRTIGRQDQVNVYIAELAAIMEAVEVTTAMLHTLNN
jgi:hypothetical protein